MRTSTKHLVSVQTDFFFEGELETPCGFQQSLIVLLDQHYKTNWGWRCNYATRFFTIL